MPASRNFPDLPKSWHETDLSFFATRTSGTRPSAKQGRLKARLWQKNSLPQEHRKALFLVHGFGENCDRYRHFPSQLEATYDAVFAFDHWGHGRSEGARGDCDSAETWLESTLLAYDEACRAFPEAEWTWLGHSFGGLITLSLLRLGRLPGPQNRLHRLYVSAPLLALAIQVPYFKKKVGEWIEPLLPHLSLKSEIDPHVVSHDLSVVEFYTSDPLNQNRITPRAFKEMNLLMDQTRAWQGSSRSQVSPLELNLILPGADPLVDSDVTRNWFQRLDSTVSKRLFELAGFFHESFNEIDRAKAFQLLRPS